MKNFLAVLTLALLLGNSAAAEDCQSALVGEWVLKPTAERIVVKENMATFHSKWGDGDIKHLNADRYMVTWYSPKSGKPFRSCQAIFTRTINGDINVWNPSKSKDCEFGTLSRRSDSGRWIPDCKIVEPKRKAPAPSRADAEEEQGSEKSSLDAR